jgi:RNA polymerase sigma factor (sigma-70 family)
MSDHPHLSGDELEALWREAWRLARRACHTTLARLRAGQGGFYGADDLHQDLFLGFRRLALAWAAREPRPPESELWAAWRRHLWHGGARYYRRRPQRLWTGVELPLTPALLALDLADDAEGRVAADALSPDAARQLVQRDEATTELERNDAARELAAALRTLTAEQRRLLEMVALQGRSIAEAACALGLPPGQATHQRLYRARRALARALRRSERTHNGCGACPGHRESAPPRRHVGDQGVRS